MYKWMVRVTSIGSAPSSLLSGRFMWVDLQLEASLETARINVIQWQLHSDEGLPFWRVHAHIAGVSPPHTPSWLSTDLSERSGSRLLLSPFVGRALLIGRPQILLVDVIDTPCLLP